MLITCPYDNFRKNPYEKPVGHHIWEGSALQSRFGKQKRICPLSVLLNTF